MQQKAKWGLLYTIVPLSLGLLWLDSRLTLRPLDHRLLEVGIVLVSFGLMAVWVRANQRAIAEESCGTIVYALPADRNWDRGSNRARETGTTTHRPTSKDKRALPQGSTDWQYKRKRRNSIPRDSKGTK